MLPYIVNEPMYRVSCTYSPYWSLYVRKMCLCVCVCVCVSMHRDCGTILNVNIVFDNFTGMICAAYIEFDTLQAQQTALKKDRSLLLDQVIIVKPKPVTKRPAAAAVPAPGAAAAATRAAPARLADAPPLPGKAAKTWVRPTGPAAQPTTG